MTLETLIDELQKIHAMHPNAGLITSMDAKDGEVVCEVGCVRYDHIGKHVVIELD
jgi:hypothetical protein